MSALELDAPRGFVSMREYLRLQRRCDALEDRVHELTALLPVAYEAKLMALRRVFPMHPQSARALMLLMNAKTDAVIRHQQILTQVSANAESDNLVKVICWKANKAIRDAGGPKQAIRNVYGVGYVIDPADKAWIRAAAPEAFEGDKP